MKTGLVLSGGGVLGMAHIGIIRALQEENIEVDCIAGVSAGALVGALYAAGQPVEEILTFFKKTPLFSWSFYAFQKPGWFLTDKYRDHLKRLIPVDDYASLKRQLFVLATDLEQGDEHIFSEGPLIQSLLASAAVPGIFTPVEINGHWYADGGIVNNFPIEVLREQCDKVIGSFVCPVKPVSKDDLNSSLKIAYRAYELSIYSRSLTRIKNCDLVLQPLDLYDYSWYDTSKIDEIYKIGYRESLKLMPEIKAYLNKEVEHC